MALRSAKSSASLKQDNSTVSGASAAPTTSSNDRSSDSSYRVYIRCRPFLNNDRDPTDESAFPLPPFEIRNGKECVFIDPSTGMPKERFMFDGAFCSITPQMWQRIPELAGMPADSSFFPPVETQEMMYKHCAEPVVPWVLDGYNASILAYGQTSSGKTHTMMGSPNDEGIIPRLAKDLLQGAQNAKIRNAEIMSLPPESRQQRIVELSKGNPNGDLISGFQLVDFTMDVAFFEIYNENVLDLLQDVPHGTGPNATHRKRKVRSHPSLGVYIDGLTYATVTSWEQCDALLAKGVEHRHVAATKMNATSSRSHAVMQFRMTQTEMSELGPLQKRSNVYLADLAGSERIKATQVEGQQLKEAAQINKSLTTLRRVIDALISNRKSEMVPYRDSLLTWVLSDALGGNARSAMIATLCPNPLYCEESFNTLQYASRAKSIVSNVVKNEDQMTQMIRSLQDAIAKEQGAAIASMGGLSSGPTPEQIAEMKAKEERLAFFEKESEETKGSLMAAHADLSALQERITKEVRDKTRAEDDNRQLHKKAVTLSDELEELREQLMDSQDQRQTQKQHIDKLELEVARLLEEKSTLQARLRQEAASAYMPMLRWYHGALSCLESSLLQPKRSALTGGVVTAAVEYVKSQHVDHIKSSQQVTFLKSEIERLQRRSSEHDATIGSLAKSYMEVREFLQCHPVRASTKAPAPSSSAAMTTAKQQKGHAVTTSAATVLGGPIPSNLSVMEMLKVFHTFTEECASNPTVQRFAEKEVPRRTHIDPGIQPSPRRSQHHPAPNAQAPCPTPLRLPSHADLNLISPWRKGASSPTSTHTAKHTAKRTASSASKVPVSSNGGAYPPPTGPTASDIVNELRKKYPLLQQHQGGGSTTTTAGGAPCSYNGGRWPGASLVGLDASLFQLKEKAPLPSTPRTTTGGGSQQGQSYAASTASTGGGHPAVSNSPHFDDLILDARSREVSSQRGFHRSASSPSAPIPSSDPHQQHPYTPDRHQLLLPTPMEAFLSKAQKDQDDMKAYIANVTNDIPLVESQVFSAAESEDFHDVVSSSNKNESNFEAADAVADKQSKGKKEKRDKKDKASSDAPDKRDKSDKKEKKDKSEKKRAASGGAAETPTKEKKEKSDKKDKSDKKRS